MPWPDKSAVEEPDLFKAVNTTYKQMSGHDRTAFDMAVDVNRALDCMVMWEAVCEACYEVSGVNPEYKEYVSGVSEWKDSVGSLEARDAVVRAWPLMVQMWEYLNACSRWDTETNGEGREDAGGHFAYDFDFAPHFVFECMDWHRGVLKSRAHHATWNFYITHCVALSQQEERRKQAWPAPDWLRDNGYYKE